MSEKFFSKETFKNTWYFLIAAVIPLLILQVVFSVPKVAQDVYTILCSDLNGQYVNYFVYFRNAIINREPILYTFSGLLGNDTAGLLGYYILSPFNLVFLFYPEVDIGAAVFLVIKLKVMAAGMTSAWYFGRKRGFKIYCLLFSTAYAASAFVFAYFMHVMWLDGVLILPVVAIGIDRLIEKKGKLLYPLSLLYSFVTCYYIGYMVAGFSVLYFIYKLFYERRTKKEYLSLSGWFVLLSILTGGASAVVLIPIAVSQLQSDTVKATEKVIHSATQLISRFYTGTFDETQFILGGPHIYCGMLILVLVILSFTYWKGSVRERLCSLFLIGSVGISFVIDKLDLFWHLMSRPHYFNHRYAFVFVFILVVLAEECFSTALDKLSIVNVVIADVLLVGMAVVLLIFPHSTVNRVLIAIDIVCIIGVSVLVYILKYVGENGRFTSISVLFAVTVVMLTMNGIQYVNQFGFDDHSTGAYYAYLNPVTSYVKESDKGFYRLEKDFAGSNNDSLMFGYNGLSFFSSSDRKIVRDFVGDIGYNDSGLWAIYDRGATIAGDSLMGMKYFLSRDEYSEYEEVGRYDDVRIYKNNNALSIGMTSSPEIKNLVLEDDRPFENLESVYSALLGREVDLFDMYDYSIDCAEDMFITEEEDSYIIFSKYEEDGSGLCYYRFTAKDDQPVYLFIATKNVPTVMLSVNGEEYGEYIATYHQSVVPLGRFTPGEEVEIELTLTSAYAGMYKPQIAALNEEVFAEAINELKLDGWSIRKHNNTRIVADVIALQNESFFTSIPYYDGWKVYVDGKKVETYKVCGTLLGFDIPEGMHSVELKYTATGLLEGGIVSAISIFAFGVITFLDSRKNRKLEEIRQ